MRNNFKKLFILIFIIFYSNSLYGNELNIKAINVEVSKDEKILYAKGEVEVSDKKGNTIYSDEAEYDKLNEIIKTIGPTKIITSEKYEIIGEGIIYDDKKKIIYSEEETIITDIDGNRINVNMFNYLTNRKMFFSTGDIELYD